MKARKNIQWMLILLLMALFLYSAIAKLMNFQEFSSELSKSPFVHRWSGFLSWSVPITEIAVSLLLLKKTTQIYSLYAYFFIMASFTAYVYLMMKEAYYLPCACGGLLISGLNWKGHLALNSLFVLFALLAIILEDKERGKETISKAVSTNYWSK